MSDPASTVMEEARTPKTPARHTRLSRSTNACQRCRRRKQRCDLRVPKCTSCETAQVPCLTYDGEKQSEIPRGYVSTLESQVKHLKRELEDLRSKQARTGNGGLSSPAEAIETVENPNIYSPGAASTIDSAASDPQDVVKSMGLVTLHSDSQPRFMGTSSGVTFAKLVLIAVKGFGDSPSPSWSSQAQPRLDVPSPAISSSLPPRHAGMHIVDVYCRYRTAHVPVLTRPKIDEILNRVYNTLEHQSSDGDLVADIDLFICHMVIAVGLCSMQVREGTRPPQSEGCFNSALSVLDKLLTYSPSDMETLTVVLLLAQYVALNPCKGSLWQLTGMALRLCVDMGLHWETEAVLAKPDNLLNERRRLFWATYRLDRVLVITLGRPFGIADQSINAGYPNPYVQDQLGSNHGESNAEAHNQRVANHIVSLYRLKSEIKHVLYHQLRGATLAYPRANYALWLKDIQPRLSAWYDEIPDLSKAHPESIYSHQSWWDSLWYDAVLLLHRPNPLVPHPTAESLKTCFSTASRCIGAIKTLQREGKVAVPWESVHRLFLAGLTMIYCIWQSAAIRESTNVLDLMATTQDCASTLSAFTERFPDAAGCRDTFERLSGATMKWVVSQESGTEAEQREPRLGSEIHALRNQVPFSNTGWRMDEPASIFPDEPFEFAEYLSAAAQWPGLDAGRAPTLFDIQGSFENIMDF